MSLGVCFGWRQANELAANRSNTGQFGSAALSVTDNLVLIMKEQRGIRESTSAHQEGNLEFG
jgi:hypothetical protein